MKKRFSLSKAITGILAFLVMTVAHAGAPLWTFTPDTGFLPKVTVSTTETATIKYTVTNQSHKSHTLQMKSILGIAPSGCTSPLGYHQSCTLTLVVNGSSLRGDVLGGPVLCDQGNPNQCYQPSQANSLLIRLIQQPPIQQYTVTSSAGNNGSVSPSGTQTVNPGATLTFTATPDTVYGVNQCLVDDAVVQAGGTTYQLNNITANHIVNVTFGTATLTPSVSTLALSINCHSSSCSTMQNAALTGNPRQIKIQNQGSVSATNVSVSASGLPSGTNISSNTCTGTLITGGSCIITLTPGPIASSDSSGVACTSGTQPVKGTVTITADNGLSTQVNAYVLGYGCIYQSGFIYSVDDTTNNGQTGACTSPPCAGSIGGKVVTTSDQSSSIIWSSNGSGSPSFVAIYGISETSTSSAPNPSTGQVAGQIACRGNIDGSCDSNNIYVYYQNYAVNAPINPSLYAAGLCKATINGYNDWYLPAICELGYNTTATTTGCGNSTSPTLQNIQSNLYDNSDIGGLTIGGYWSSTEYSLAPGNEVWVESFGYSQSQDFGGMGLSMGVRCSRAF